MFEEMVMVAVMSALLGMVAGLLVRPAIEMAKGLVERGLAVLWRKAKRGQSKPKMKRAAKVKAAKEPTASRSQPKAIPVALAEPVAVADSAKPKKKVGRPSKAELARRAALEQEKATSEALQVAPPTTGQTTTESVPPRTELTSGQLQELAVFHTADCPANQPDKLEKASST